MNGVRWDLLKVALKSPYVVLIGLFTVSMAVATAVMLGGTLYLTFDRMVAVLGSEFFGSSRLIIPLIVFVFGALFTVIPGWLTKLSWDTLAMRANEVREDARRVGEQRVLAAENARRTREQGGMMSVSVDALGSGSLTKAEHVGNVRLGELGSSERRGHAEVSAVQALGGVGKAFLKGLPALVMASLTASAVLAAVFFVRWVALEFWSDAKHGFDEGVADAVLGSLFPSGFFALGCVMLAWRMGGMTRALFGGVSEQVREAREAARAGRAERAERAEAIEAQGGMLSMNVPDDGGEPRTQVAESGRALADEEVAMDFGEGDEAEQVVHEEVHTQGAP